MRDLDLHGVGIEPGRSIGVGAVGEAPVVVLPGPPVACLLGAVLFCRPALGWLVDSDLPPVHTTAARLAR